MYAVCLSLLSPATVSVEAATAIKISSAPKGFESLTEPQTTLVDVFYAGRAVVSTLATYTDDTITIANPLEVVSNIPKVKESDALVRSLTGVVAEGIHPMGVGGFRKTLFLPPKRIALAELILRVA